MREIETRTSPSVAGQCEPREGSKPTESILTRLMTDLDTRPNEGTDRQEPTDDRPLLEGDIADHDGELNLLVQPDWMLNGTNPDEWYQTTAFIEFDSREELA